MQVGSQMSAVNEKYKPSQLPALVSWLIDVVLSVRQTRDRHKYMELLETLPLGGKRQLILVMCDGERFLVGAGTDCVQAIARIGEGPRQYPSESTKP
jgi:flagellar biogenesis protein FliO